jgi:hypothetical protein
MRFELLWDITLSTVLIPYHTISSGEEVQVFLDFLTLENGTDMFFRNVGKELPIYAT